ncbi:MAG TPA: ATP-dependent protease subunit HslV [candidate division Zixibacteria bacterium]|nr:ATP-dependent protease subunit HslV [candidate division Zixibacteria bacterium]MDD4917077.1 ATP-dependent protease subunit HslV [candidate division Zixibacteria bacterium]MDM7972941.1 ATP-dependent protease subunit HslV [candidate division Zixibacteria bacterium]HOD65303.1 ATP-dependent protease subunit HslV [candidate division Zixibacteria bacterium]HOZ08513.1 ATP-dependent protease subunit HslV [candidate division Zixibacteria bacterium]
MRTRSTTIIGIIHNGRAAMAGDGQITFEDTIVKARSSKIRTMREGTILCGFAGTAADALALYELLEKKTDEYAGNLARAAVELAKEWRTDKALQRLEAVIAVTDGRHIFLVSGNGDVIEPDDQIVAIGSGGSFALAAARALVWANPKLSADKIAVKALEIAAGICIFTNAHITVETLG